MTGTLFEVVVDGSLKEGQDRQGAHENLAKLLNVPTERLAQMLAGAPLVIKRGIDSARAETYKAAIEKTGAGCRISAISKLRLIGSRDNIDLKRVHDFL